MTDDWNALLPTTSSSLLPASAGVLHGRSFVVKDTFDVAGHATAAGSPMRRSTVPVATTTARAVTQLLAAGAAYAGRARCDELAFSLGGVNVLDGTPRNPAAPGHTCGGSSSGSAAAVAGGLADIGLGTDTAGSIRVPASYCGLVGMRPTHGRVSVDGLLPLAPSYDTVGWLTRSGDLAADVGRALLRNWRAAPPPTALYVVTDLLPTDAADATLVRGAAARWSMTLGAPVTETELGRIDEWVAAFQVLRSAEAWAVHGEWLSRHPDAVSEAVAARLQAGAVSAPDQLAAAAAVEAEMRVTLADLLSPGVALVVPAAAVRAPSLEAPDDALDGVRARTLRVTTIAALAGAPSVALPVTTDGGLPFGAALLGRPGDDESLLAAAVAIGASYGTLEPCPSR